MSQLWGNMQAEEFEQLSAGLTHEQFERLCQCLIAVDFPHGLPVFSGRGNTADGGNDAVFWVDDIGQTRHLTSPGLNVYEVKWRSPFQRDKSFEYLCKTGEKAPLHQKLKKQRTHFGKPIFLRVFVNLNLSRSEQEKLVKLIRADCDCSESQVELVDAGRIALLLNLNAHLRAAIRPGESLQLHSEWKSDILQRTRNQGGPQKGQFIGRKAELKTLRDGLQDSSRRLFRVSGPPGIGKTRFVAEAVLDDLSLKTVVAADDTVFEGSAWTQLRRQEFLLILDEPSETLERKAIEKVLSTENIRLLVISRRQAQSQVGCLTLFLGGLEREDAWQLCNNLLRKNTQWDTGWLVEQLAGNPGLLLAAAQTTLQPQADLPGYVRELGRFRAEKLTDSSLFSVAQLHALSETGLLIGHSIPEELGFPTLTRSQHSKALDQLKTLGFIEQRGKRYLITPSALADYLVDEYWSERASSQAFSILLEENSEFSTDVRNALLRTLSPTSQKLARHLLESIDLTEMNRKSPELAQALLEQQAAPFAEKLRALSSETTAQLPLVLVRKLISVPETAQIGLQILRDRVMHAGPGEKMLTETYYTLFLPQWPDIALSLEERREELDALRTQVGTDSPHYWEALNGMLGDSRMTAIAFDSVAKPSGTREFDPEQILKYRKDAVVRGLKDAESSSVGPQHLIRFAENLFDRDFRDEGFQLYQLLASRELFDGTGLLSSLSLKIKHEEAWRDKFRDLRQDIFQRAPLQELAWWTESWPRIENDQNYERVQALRRERFGVLAKGFLESIDFPDFAELQEKLFYLRDFFEILGSLDHSLTFSKIVPDEVFADYWKGVSRHPDGEKKVLAKLWCDQTSASQRFQLACRLTPTQVPPEQMLALATSEELESEEFDRAPLYLWTQGLENEALVDFLKGLSHTHRNSSRSYAEELDRGLRRESLRQQQVEALLGLGEPLLKSEFEKSDPYYEVPDFSLTALFHTALEKRADLVSKLYLETVFSAPEDDDELRLHKAARSRWFDEMCQAAPLLVLNALIQKLLKCQQDWISLTFHLRERFPTSLLKEWWEQASNKTRDEAALVAMLSNGQDDDFWLLAQELLSTLDYDSELQALLFQAACYFGTSYWGPESEQLKRLKPRFTHPAGQELLSSRMLALISSMGDQLERRITGRVVWEYDLNSEEFRQMLDSRDDEERKWAYLRILNQVPAKEWGQWLEWPKLKEELPRLPMEAEKKADIESLVEYLCA